MVPIDIKPFSIVWKYLFWQQASQQASFKCLSCDNAQIIIINWLINDHKLFTFFTSKWQKVEKWEVFFQWMVARERK